MFDTVFVIIFIDKKEIAHKALWHYLFCICHQHTIFYRAEEWIAKKSIRVSQQHTEIIEHKPDVLLLVSYLVT
ncbi:MAG TPA: hypothetical protein VE732_03095, partial [Nitrososphaera sp.]|nr:hypothetical protein [Nitrososphaera sp.]